MAVIMVTSGGPPGRSRCERVWHRHRVGQVTLQTHTHSLIDKYAVSHIIVMGNALADAMASRVSSFAELLPNEA